ncbi:MAG: RagB/SusD family nutrient uptake outer membrane protein [Chitinophagaceae bacterium]|nr:RagB/SusD family nutrient uptake outer membrane protein [Chitinophagaceae bacterium]
MIKHISYFIFSFAVLASTSCRKYVEVNQPNQRSLKYVSDYQALLNNVNTFETSASLPLLSEDDVDINGTAALENRLTAGFDNVYTWAADYYTASQADATWNQLYNLIYNCNVIIGGVMSSQNGTDQQKAQLIAEAKVQRAYTYLLLNNMYAPVYTASTAGTSLAAPLLLSPDLFANLTRPSLQKVYDQILSDLTTALPSLPVGPSNKLHAGKAAAYATLARTYLYMQQYTQAATNAAQALAIQDSVLDLSKVTNLSNYPRRMNNPEVILSKSCYPPGFLNLPLSNELLSFFTSTDKRYTLYTRDGASFYPSFAGRGSYKYNLFSGDYLSTGPTVPEMMLIRAEGLARNNYPDSAMDLVNRLRIKRFDPADYTALTAATGPDALKVVLAERRRELFDMGLRWFDQRRLSLESTYAETETRVFKGVTYTLTPGSNRYVYPIAAGVIQLNPEIKQNDR